MAEKGFTPIQVTLEPDKRYSWCSCSYSDDQPFCDGSHRAHKAGQPLVFEVKETREGWLCVCKRTSTPPYCDGTHNDL